MHAANRALEAYRRAKEQETVGNIPAALALYTEAREALKNTKHDVFFERWVDTAVKTLQTQLEPKMPDQRVSP
jgi:hypothetical protein